MGYNPRLSASVLQEKHNITGYTANEDQNIEAYIKARERYLTYMFLRGSENLRYKQTKTYLKNSYIMGMDGYPQDLQGVMKLLNNYIA